MTYELATISTHDLDNVTGAGGYFDYLMQQKQQPKQPAHAPAGGSSGPNFLQRWGKNMQTGGEYVMAGGAVGSAVPALGETGIPEAVAAGGGASWLLGKGVSAVGNLFHH
jgi:hypothetical protein